MNDAATNRERVLRCIFENAQGLDDDEISELAGVKPRQQVHQIASRLADEGLIRRISVVKQGKRRKIHNFPIEESRPLSETRPTAVHNQLPQWRKRLAALVAATGREESDILDKALERYARDLVQNGFE